jgi:hypothetical protein
MKRIITTALLLLLLLVCARRREKESGEKGLFSAAGQPILQCAGCSQHAITLACLRSVAISSTSK